MGTATAGDTVRALAFPALVGSPEIGDRVLLNVSALARGLGTGGYALVIALPDRPPVDPPDGPGHLVKARYTPLQAMVLGVDDQESPHHDAPAGRRRPRRHCPWWSRTCTRRCPRSSPARGSRRARGPEAAPRVAYVMTDGGALPAWFSRTIAGLRVRGVDRGLHHHRPVVRRATSRPSPCTRACSPRGTWSAPTSWSSRRDRATSAPGRAGASPGSRRARRSTRRPSLGGRPVGSLRVSGADARERHLGVSHHSLTAYGRVALAPADVVVPVLEGDLGQRVRDAGGRARRPAPPGRGRRRATSCSPRSRTRPCGCRPWAAASTRTPRRSSRRPRPGCTPRSL